MKRVMVDLETMGTGPMSAIISIGAVRFDLDGLDGEFRARVDLQSSLDVGMTVDASTIFWWMKQSDEARSIFSLDRGHPLPLRLVLGWFAEFLGGVDELWGNGSDFDNTILASAYRLCNMQQPWKFSVNRCYRTMKKLRPEILMERTGTHHNAGDDAKSQALHLVEILKLVLPVETVA